jgi:hypothetical protein
MIDTWETGSDGVMMWVGVFAVVLVLGIAIGVKTEKSLMEKQAVAAGAAYWTAGEDGKAVFKYVTQ